MGLILIETQNIIARMPVGLPQWLAAASKSRLSVAVSEREFNIHLHERAPEVMGKTSAANNE